jgi:hypothetical protein
MYIGGFISFFLPNIVKDSNQMTVTWHKQANYLGHLPTTSLTGVVWILEVL